MSQSLSSVVVHIVFSTKERLPFLSDEDVRRKVHAFLGGIAKNLNCPPILIGGVSDHLHILIQLGRSVSQADLVKELKRGSNLWIQERFPQIAKFAWQAGYGAPFGQASDFGAVGRLISIVVPLVWFLFITVAFCLRLPSDSSSRRTPLPFG